MRTPLSLGKRPQAAAGLGHPPKGQNPPATRVPRAHKQRRCHRIPSGRAKPRVWKRVSLVNNGGWTDWQRDRLKQGECDLCPSEELRVQLKWEHRPAQRLTRGLPASSKSVWFILLGKQTDPCLSIFGYEWSSGKRYSAWTSIMAFVQPPSVPQNRARPQELKFGPRKRSLRPSVKSTSSRRPALDLRHATYLIFKRLFNKVWTFLFN